jgi:hypothetical protein
VEEPNSEIGLEFLDGLAEQPLLHAKPICPSRKLQFLGNNHEVAKLTKHHNAPEDCEGA